MKADIIVILANKLFLGSIATYPSMTQVQVQLFEAESISELQMKLNEFLRGIDEEIS
jgi:hypothetical protein